MRRLNARPYADHRLSEQAGLRELNNTTCDRYTESQWLVLVLWLLATLLDQHIASGPPVEILLSRKG